MKYKLYVGGSPLETARAAVSDEQVQFDGEAFYRIASYDQLRPFFMSMASSADHWMFISSTGALTAGRRNRDNALFPYYTDDKIHDSAGISGSKTVAVVRKGARRFLWNPFSDRHAGLYRIRRNLLKNVCGNKIVFEEINESLSLTFRYGWFNSERFGFIRRSWLFNSGKEACEARIADGIQNILPSGIGSQFQLEKSTLLDAYKRNELDPESSLGLFTLSSIPIDRPEPAESLKATTVWSISPGQRSIRLCANGIDHFFQTENQTQELEVRGERGAYILDLKVHLRAGGSAEWLMAADVNQSHSRIMSLQRLLREPNQLKRLVLEDVARGTEDLRRIVAGADGLQRTRRELGDARHYGNVLFNVMRGGTFPEGYRINAADLRSFVQRANRHTAARHQRWLKRLPPELTYGKLTSAAASTGDPQLERICREYLPLTFSRRHGDPSRPWNSFSIATLDKQGNRVLNYEGNWRDIFQNWEALALSFPGFTQGMICKFLNASTADGYNPYRITRDGLDWEVKDPHDPWSFIGYWGDHQVIYLVKLIEILQRHDPETLNRFLVSPIFAYANVPYRIKNYTGLLEDPRDTVEFDGAADALARKREQEIGADGKLLLTRRGDAHLANLAEKLLVSILAKLSNFVPEAGIWLNTQRPEWNDANNALVGSGASMVTLCYMRREFAFLASVFQQFAQTEFSVSRDVAVLSRRIHRALKQHGARLGIGSAAGGNAGGPAISDKDRRQVLDELGKAGSAYRGRFYKSGLSTEPHTLRGTEITDLFSIALAWVDHSIRANRRKDGLFEAYNLIQVSKEGIGIRRLYPMLEGQVAVLSSGLLSAEESLNLLTALRSSSLFREDQHSYLLYPDRELCPFLTKNRIPAAEVKRSTLLQRLIRDGNTDVVERDEEGRVHFNENMRNSADLARSLDRLAGTPYGRLASKEKAALLQTFEKLFDHESFTGRSGTFFAYEGLGSIYWHMISKLLLAAQESFYRAAEAGASQPVLKGLAAAYYDIRAGLGDAKDPEQYGAFPMDPYSHTPRHKGACQPGLTGQVKEDILCRWGELGISVKEGRIHFDPQLLRDEEFLRGPAVFAYFDTSGERRTIRLQAGSLAFTYCQTPIVYRLNNSPSVKVLFTDGTIAEEALELNETASQAILNRTGAVRQVEVCFPASRHRKNANDPGRGRRFSKSRLTFLPILPSRRMVLA